MLSSALGGGGGVLSEFVCRNTFPDIWPILENHLSEGAIFYIFGKVSSLGAKKFKMRAIGATIGKLLQ